MTYSEYREYWQTIATSHKDILDFAFCDSAETIAQSLSNKKSPCLWVDAPDINWGDNNQSGLHRRYVSDIVICKSVQLDNQKTKYEAIEFLLEILFEIVRKLKEDYEYNRIGFMRIESDFTEVQTDNFVGWRVEIAIGNDIRIDTNSSKWE